MKSLTSSPRRAAYGLALVLVALLPACGRRDLAPMMSSRGGSNPNVQITIQNNDFKDASVYAVWASVGGSDTSGQRSRVGFVTGKTSKTFTVGLKGGYMRLEADFIAGGSFRSDAIDVAEGDHIDLVIMNQG